MNESWHWYPLLKGFLRIQGEVISLFFECCIWSKADISTNENVLYSFLSAVINILWKLFTLVVNVHVFYQMTTKYISPSKRS